MLFGNFVFFINLIIFFINNGVFLEGFSIIVFFVVNVIGKI